MATRKKIEQLGAEIVPGTKAKIDSVFLTDGLTEKNFQKASSAADEQPARNGHAVTQSPSADRPAGD
jgi:hypothetical protein